MPPSYEDVIPGAEKRHLLEADTKQRDWEYRSVCDGDFYRVVTNCVYNSLIKPITNPKPVYSHSVA
jgi:hypothetical protein